MPPTLMAMWRAAGPIVTNALGGVLGVLILRLLGL